MELWPGECDRTPFRAAIAFHPQGSTLTGTDRVLTPTLLLLGSADNWTLPSASLRLASEHRDDDSLRAIVYQGATHSWDEPGGTRTIFNGAILAFDPVATEASTVGE